MNDIGNFSPDCNAKATDEPAATIMRLKRTDRSTLCIAYLLMEGTLVIKEQLLKNLKAIPVFTKPASDKPCRREDPL